MAHRLISDWSPVVALVAVRSEAGCLQPKKSTLRNETKRDGTCHCHALEDLRFDPLKALLLSDLQPSFFLTTKKKVKREHYAEENMLEMY